MKGSAVRIRASAFNAFAGIFVESGNAPRRLSGTKSPGRWDPFTNCERVRRVQRDLQVVQVKRWIAVASFADRPASRSRRSFRRRSPQFADTAREGSDRRPDDRRDRGVRSERGDDRAPALRCRRRLGFGRATRAGAGDPRSVLARPGARATASPRAHDRARLHRRGILLLRLLEFESRRTASLETM
jgi:hypothetical protein